MTDYELLARDLRRLADTLEDRGADTDTRLESWTRGPTPGDTHDTPPQPGDPDYEGPADTPAWIRDLTDDDRPDAARAARLHRTWTRLIHQIEAATPRLIDLDKIAHPKPATRQRLDTPAQVAADGFCRSCWRDDHYLKPTATGRYRDHCRWCGDWLATEGQPPPIEALRIVHQRARQTRTDRFYLTADEYETIVGRPRTA